MNITTEDYQAIFDPANFVVTIKGSLRLAGVSAYEPLKNLIIEAEQQAAGKLTWDLSGLKFLNSSGITTLSMHLFAMKKQAKVQLKVIGSKDIPWQEKSLRNLKKIWNEIEIIIN